MLFANLVPFKIYCSVFKDQLMTKSNMHINYVNMNHLNKRLEPE